MKKCLISLFSKKGIKYFEKDLFNPTKPRFHNMDLKRSIITSISRLRSGHCNSKALLFRFGMVDSPMCYCGRSTKNISRIFLSCPRYEEARNKLLIRLRDLDIPFPSEDIYPLLTNHLMLLPLPSLIFYTSLNSPYNFFYFFFSFWLSPSCYIPLCFLCPPRPFFSSSAYSFPYIH